MDIRSLKNTERNFREKTIPFGVHTVTTKTKWFSEVELYNVLSSLGLSDGRDVLDAGCSDGRFLEYLHFKFSGCRLYGMDFALNPLKVCEAKAFKKSLVCADMCELPFKAGSFDIVVSIQVVHHIPSAEERAKAFESIKRVLRNDGTMVITVLNQAWWYNLVENGKEGPLLTARDLQVYLYDPEDLRAELEAAGFKVLDIRGINNVPASYLKRLGMLGVLLDVAITKIFPGISLKKGCYLLASCRKKLK